MANGKSYTCSTLCELIHAESAQVLGTYAEDFYAGTPCVTVNEWGGGKAYYIATRADAEFLDDFYATLMAGADIVPPVRGLSRGVQVTRRGNTLFVMNFTPAEVSVDLPEGTDALNGGPVGGLTAIAAWGLRVVTLNP